MRPRENPFRSDRLDAIRYRPMDGIVERFERAGWRGSIVGPEGSGKTTLVEELIRQLDARGVSGVYVRVQRDGRLPRLKGLGRGDVLFVDGADLLSKLQWFRTCWVARNASGLVITAHRSGLLPTAVETRGSARVLDQLKGELLPPFIRDLTPPALGDLMDQAAPLIGEVDEDLPPALRALLPEHPAAVDHAVDRAAERGGHGAHARGEGAHAHGPGAGEDDEDAELRQRDLLQGVGDRAGDDTQQRAGCAQRRLRRLVRESVGLHGASSLALLMH